jgi:hypothetical protein
MVRVHSDTNWLLRNEFFHSKDRNVVLLLSSSVSPVLVISKELNFAIFLLKLVPSGVLIPGLDTIGSYEVIGVKHPSTIASIVDVIAIEQVLN